MARFIFDGNPIELVDQDNDGYVDRFVSDDRNETEIREPTEIGEALREVNSDIVDKSTRMSSIDMKARLSHDEVGAILAFDTLIAMKFLPRDALFLTRQRKRLSVSEDGQGRQEAVEIVQGERAKQENIGGWDKLKSMFKPKPKEPL